MLTSIEEQINQELAIEHEQRVQKYIKEYAPTLIPHKNSLPKWDAKHAVKITCRCGIVFKGRRFSKWHSPKCRSKHYKKWKDEGKDTKGNLIEGKA